MKLNDILEVKIEKLVYGLEGISKVDNLVIFVKEALPNETLKVKITGIFKNYLKAEIVEIIKPNPNRIKPICPYYNACGSCIGQYMDYDYLIKQKESILNEIFENVAKKILPFEKSPKVFEYRKKLQFPTTRTKDSKRLLIGYFKEKSHDITNLKFCKMQQKIIDEILDFIRNNLDKEISCFDEKTKKGLLKHIVIRKTELGIFLTFVLNDNKIDKKLVEFSKLLNQKYPQILGIFANFNYKNTNKILSNETKKILGQAEIVEKLKDKTYKMGPTSFFQVNTDCAIKLFDEVKRHTKNSKTIMDAFGGVGAIGIWVSGNNSKITLLEENLEAINYAKENFKLNGINDFEIISGDANKNIKNIDNNFNTIILDPPRKGATKEGLEAFSRLTNRIIYVSCNPMTLKRDALILKEFGFEMKEVKGFDMFPYTPHIECVCLFEKA